ncbi:hypothetical protein DFJ63DRAFT_336116 [Scheffersomyces coipomensis]|uniref:uncharacterized protein n=1 Tax=Scheffersomyces coipomensis TaxID=1788519 RepID=UPI00315D9F55
MANPNANILDSAFTNLDAFMLTYSGINLDNITGAERAALSEKLTTILRIFNHPHPQEVLDQYIQFQLDVQTRIGNIINDLREIQQFQVPPQPQQLQQEEPPMINNNNEQQQQQEEEQQPNMINNPNPNPNPNTRRRRISRSTTAGQDPISTTMSSTLLTISSTLTTMSSTMSSTLTEISSFAKSQKKVNNRILAKLDEISKTQMDIAKAQTNMARSLRANNRN